MEKITLFLAHSENVFMNSIPNGLKWITPPCQSDTTALPMYVIALCLGSDLCLPTEMHDSLDKQPASVLLADDSTFPHNKKKMIPIGISCRIFSLFCSLEKLDQSACELLHWWWLAWPVYVQYSSSEKRKPRKVNKLRGATGAMPSLMALEHSWMVRAILGSLGKDLNHFGISWVNPLTGRWQ